MHYVATFNPRCRLYKLIYHVTQPGPYIDNEDWGDFYYDDERSRRFLISVFSVEGKAVNDLYLFKYRNGIKAARQGKPSEVIAEKKFLLFQNLELAKRFIRSQRNLIGACGQIFELMKIRGKSSTHPEHVKMKLSCSWDKLKDECEFIDDNLILIVDGKRTDTPCYARLLPFPEEEDK